MYERCSEKKVKPDDASRHERVLILAPTGRDAALAQRILSDAGLHASVCKSIDDLAAECCDAGALLIAEEAIHTNDTDTLIDAIDAQPAWSDLPVLIFTANASSEARMRSWERLGQRANVTLIDRPIRIKTLLSAVQTALRNRRQQYEVRALMEQLEARIQERDKFLAILGHELRNPLTAILLSAQTIDPADPDGVRSQLETIERQARQLSRLVNDLLDISRVTTGKIRLKPERIELNDRLRHAISAMEGSFAQHGLVAKLETAHDSIPIDADPVRFDQIISNLLANAEKYSKPGGRIDVTTFIEGGQAVARIEDDGVGIAPEMLERIFDLFAQVDQTIDRSRGGMGVGLTLVRNLVELHGGEVRVRSDGVGKGSCFEIRFPLATSDAPAIAASQPRRSVMQPRRIVLIEDNSDIRKLLEIKLRSMGHLVQAADDGEKGLEILLREKPDFAFVDIGLPGLDGYEVARAFRQEHRDGTVLVALTGYGLPEDQRRAEAAGFDRHLTKPPEFEELERVLASP